MKFTSEDLLKAMGLNLKDKVYICDGYYQRQTFTIKMVKGVESEEIPMLVSNDLKLKLLNLLDHNYEIIQPKPTLTEDEKVILRNLNKRYKYINREEYGGLRVSETKPIYSKSMKEYYYSGFDTFIYDNLFQFIKWEDEPYSIEELLKEV